MPPRGRPTRNDETLSEPLLSEEQRHTSSTVSDSVVPVEPSQQSADIPSTQQPVHISRNVHLTLLYTGFAFAGRSIWIQSVLATFVYFLKHNLEAVGYITAVMGIAQLICSFPAAFIADSYRRDSMLKVASILGVFAIGSTLYALYSQQYMHLVFALIMWGCCWGVANTSLSALFADSVPAGQRSHYFTQRATLITSGFTAGPIVSLVMFAVLGDTWNVRDCAIVMGVGQIVGLPALILLCFFSDDHVVHHEEDDGNSPSIEDERNETDEEEAETCHRNAPDTPNVSSGAREESPEDENVQLQNCGFISEQRQIALLIAAADLIGGLAAGMSIRYFPIFFVDHLHMGPVKVQMLYVLSPLLNTFLMKLAQRLSTTHGRCQVSAFFKWVGIIMMFLVIVSTRLQSPKWVICTLYVLRTSFINSTGALTKSVLMDNVPKKERAKWAALESLNMFSWSGSAAIGGVLVGIIGILPLFAATATLQLIATIPLVFLFNKDLAESGDTRITERPTPSSNDDGNDDQESDS